MACARRFAPCSLLPVLVLILQLSLPQQADATSMGMMLRRNPIRRVVTMLQSMQKKINEEKKKSEKLYDRFACYCKVNTARLAKEIPENTEKEAALQSAIEEGIALHSRLEQEVKDGKESLSETKEDIEQAKALRLKEATAFIKLTRENKQNTNAMLKAIDALEKGQGVAFLQSFLHSATAKRLQQLSLDMSMSDAERDVLSEFLQGNQGNQDDDQANDNYSPVSGEVTGILKQMLETAEKDYTEAKKVEEETKRTYDAMMAAKNKQLAALSESIMSKTELLGETAIKNVDNKAELKDVSQQLVADRAFYKHLKEDCLTKDKEWEESQKVMTAELLAIADAIKILNDDDALDLFKKALPSASLLQTEEEDRDVRDDARKALRHHKKKDYRLDLIQMALNSKKVSFIKVFSMIDDMKKLLAAEQSDDDIKKVKCQSSLGKSDDKMAGYLRQKETRGKEVEDRESALAAKKEEIAKVTGDIKLLDKQVEQQEEMRKEGNAVYKEALQADISAKELLRNAKDKLLAVYATDFVQTNSSTKESQEGFSSEADEIFAPPTPKAAEVYKKKSQEGTGVLALIDMMISDLDKDIKRGDADEKTDQAEYENFLEEAQLKRGDYSSELMNLEDTKASMEAHLQEMEKDGKVLNNNILRLTEYLKDMHEDCDFLLQTYVERREARAGELESLDKAKAVLSGASYSFLQTRRIGQHLAV